MEGGRMSGLASQQDGGQFEDALRRLAALENKLTTQVQVDITELRTKWGQPRVERVTNNTFKLWQVRENLKKSKRLYVEEERLLGEFKKVKDALISASMDDEYFEATKDTCVFLGGKLTEVRNQQLLCYSASRDLETAVNKDIMTIRFEDKDYAELDLEQVRASTPLRELEPTPLDRHRSQSREPSPSVFKMPPMRLSCGTTTPGGSSTSGDPHAYFSRPGSSQSVHGGRGPATEREAKKEQEFRSKIAALQAEDDSPPTGRKVAQPSQGLVLRDAFGKVIKDDPNEVFTHERPGSAMSEMSIQLAGDSSRPGSRMDQMDRQMLGDELSRSLIDISGSMANLTPAKTSDAYSFPQGKNMLDDLDVEINLGEDAATKREEEEAASQRAADAMAEKIRADAKKAFEAKEKVRLEEEAVQKKAEAAAKAEKQKREKEEAEAAQAKEREDRKAADEKKMADLAEKRRIAAEKKAEEEAKKKEEEARKKEEEKQKKLDAKAKKEAEEKKKEDEKLKKEAEKKEKLEEKKRKMEEAKEKKRLQEEEAEAAKLEEENKAMVEALKADVQKAKEDKEKEEKERCAAEKKSLQKDVADLESGLQMEFAGRDEVVEETRPKSSAGKKTPETLVEEEPRRPKSRSAKKEPTVEESANQQDTIVEETRPKSSEGKKTPEALVEEEPRRPKSRSAKKEPSVEESANQQDKIVEEKRPKSSAGKKTPEAPVEEEPRRPKSRSAKKEPPVEESANQRPKFRAGQKDPESSEQRPKSREEVMASEPLASAIGKTTQDDASISVVAASDADDEGELVMEKPRSKSRSASRTRTAKTLEEEDSEKEEEPRKRSLSRGRPQQEEANKPKPTARSSSKGSSKEDTKDPKPKPVSRSNSKASEDAATKKMDEAGAAFVKAVKARSSSRGRAEEAEEEPAAVSQQMLTPSKPVSRSASGAGSRKVSESERKISESEPAAQTGSRQTSRGGSPVGILKGGKRSRDASKDRTGLEVPKGSGSSKDIDFTHPPEEVAAGKPLSRAASLKKSISFSKKKEERSFDEEIDEKFARAAEPLQSAKDIFAAIADTSLESGMLKSRSGSKERPGSRTSGSSFPQAEPREMPESAFDDEDELMIILDDAEMKRLDDGESQSQSHSRPGSRGSQTSQASSRQGVLKSRSASNVPELESVEVPDSLKTMIEGLRRMEDEDEEEELTRPRSGGGREPKEEFPRPLSQARPRSSASTGYSHLDEFERKLAEMEDELVNEEAGGSEEIRPGSSLRHGVGEWNLSPGMSRAIETESFQDVAQDFKKSFAENFQKLDTEAIYATVKKKKSLHETSPKTEDGYFINQEKELGGLDHSMVHDGEYMHAGSEYEGGSEYVVDETSGQRLRRSESKKVSFATSEERWEIQRETQLSGLGRMKEMLTLSAPKPMKPLPGKEPKEEDRPGSRSSRRSGSRSKEPSPSPSNFLHAMTGGLIGSRETTPLRTSNSNIFGSLLRKGRKGSRSGSQQGSRDSSGDRASDMGDIEDGRGSSMLSDAGSEGSLVMRIKDKVSRKKPKVQPQDFDELFARGLALSAQLESEQNKDPFGPKAVDLGRQMMEVGAATAAAGGDTGAITAALGDGVSGMTGVRIPDYQQKVTAYLDDQAQNPGATHNLGEEPRERGRRRHRREPKAAGGPAEPAARSQSDEKTRKTSREYTKPEDIQLSPRPKRDLFTGEMLAPGSPDALFLAKVTEFVSKNESPLPQVKANGSLPAGNPVPTVAPPGDLISSLAPPPPLPPRLAPSPGKAFLESTGDSEVFGPSVERENPPAESKKDGAMANEGYGGAATITMHKFEAAAKAAAIKVASQSPPPASPIQRGVTASVSGLPGPTEPGDKGIPTQLKPDKLMANEEFYEKLRTNLKTALTPERAFEGTQEAPESYQKYSHHLGRAEFGSLKRPSNAPSRDTSGERLNQSRVISRNTSIDKLNMAGSRKVSRQSSQSFDMRGVRSDSRASDYSIALPDLEVDPNAMMEMEREVVGGAVQRTMSDNVNDPPPAPKPTVASQDVLVRKEEVLKDMELHRQKIQEAKAWIQNGLMTVVGVGVMAYLQTLEQMGGAT